MLGIVSVNPASIPAPVQAFAPHLAFDIARRFALIVAGLAALVAHRFVRDPRLGALIVPLWTRLTRASRRFGRLMHRLAVNRRPRPSGTHRHLPAAATTARLPAGHGWLIRAIPHEAAAYAAQLETLLAEPAVAGLLATCPAAGRILRPLARMLGLPAATPKPDARPAPSAITPPRPTLLASHPFASYRSGLPWPAASWQIPASA